MSGHSRGSANRFYSTQPKNRHFDRSSSRLCELRSGGIRFSSPTFPSPQPPHHLDLVPPTSKMVISTTAATNHRSPHQPATEQAHKLEGHTFRCAENKPGQRPKPLSRRPERSPKGEATDLLPLPLPQFLFVIFCLKIACQAPKPRKPNKQNLIDVGILVPLNPLYCIYR
jgi:hypothetical protein